MRLKACFSLCILNLRRRAGLALSLAALYFLSCFFVCGCFLFSQAGTRGAEQLLDADPRASYAVARWAGGKDTSSGYPALEADISSLCAAAASAAGVAEVSFAGMDSLWGEVSVSGGQGIAQTAEFSVCYAGGGRLPQAHTSYFAAQGSAAVLFGREIDPAAAEAEVLVSLSLARGLGYERAEELVGCTLSLPERTVTVIAEEGDVASVETISVPYLPQATVVGVVADELSQAYGFAWDEFIVADAKDIRTRDYSVFELRAYCAYADREAVAAELNGLLSEETGGVFSAAEPPYAVRRFSEIVQFISAMLLLVFVLFFAAAVLTNVSASAFVYGRKRAFCRAAAACGYSRGALAFTEFLQSALLALASAVFALPAALVAARGGAALLGALGYGTFSVAFTAAAVPVALGVQLLSALLSALALRLRFAREKA